MKTFLERATATVAKGAPVIRLRPKTKKALDNDWPNLATTDVQIIQKWSEETPEANCGAVAKAELGGVWFFEIDDPSVVGRIESETGQKIPQTYRVRSRPGRGHYYWKQTPESIAMGNIAQGYVKNGDFSVRVHNEYVVAAGSLHPNTGEPYEIVCTADIVECPQWFIEWIKSQKTEPKKAAPTDDSEPIPDGKRNTTLASIAGRLRNAGLDNEGIEEHLHKINAIRCVPPLTDTEIKTIAWSIARYPVGKDDTVLIGGVPVGTAAPIVKTAYGAPPAQLPEEVIERPEILLPPYPTFPKWIMAGTSIYDGLVKPFCDVNCRQEEFMFMPAMTLLLNYVATKVQVKGKLLIPSIFMVSIGKRGELMKSACINSAIEYFGFMGITGHATDSMENANGRSLIWEIGSPEGLGKEMARLKCSNAILFYDELATLTNKASIDGSTLTSRLLAMYESGKFQNAIKNKKDSFSFEPNTYCVSLMACSTDKNFLTNWSKLAGRSTGLDDRFFFLFQPKEFKERQPYTHVYTQEASVKTHKLIEKAIKQGSYQFSDTSPLAIRPDLDNREEIRVEKFALGFAIDMGLDEIDEECIERGFAIVDYEKAVKKWLRTYEATTKEGALQMEIKSVLARQPRGEMVERDLKRECHADRHGTTLWGQSFGGLVKNGHVLVQGTGKKNDPKIVILLIPPDEDND